MGKKVIAIDADPDANLANTLGFPEEVEITPLVEMKELIRERVGAAPGEATVYFKLNPKVDDIPDTFSVEHEKIKLMVMGTVRRGGSGCVCPENVMLKELLNHLLIQRDEVVLLDMEAGIEHLGRGTARFVEVLLAVVEPTTSSIHTFHRIKKLTDDLHIKNLAVIANQIRDEAELERIKSETGMEPWCVIPFADSLRDYHGDTIDETIAVEINKVKEKIEHLNKESE